MDPQTRIEAGDMGHSKAGAITVDAGSYMKGFGDLNGKFGLNHGWLIDNGEITVMRIGGVQQDTRLILPSVVTGSGSITIEQGMTLITGGVVDGPSVSFTRSTGEHLELIGPGEFKSTINHFLGTNKIDLEHITNATASFAGRVLTVTSNGEIKARLHFSGNYTTANFKLTDTFIGTRITYQPTAADMVPVPKPTAVTAIDQPSHGGLSWAPSVEHHMVLAHS